MYPQIIKCPNCNSLFKLNQKPSKFFSCPKCKYQAPFDQIMRQNDAPVTQPEHPTAKVVTNAGSEVIKYDNYGERTKLVPGLQQPTSKTATLNMVFKGVAIGKVTLPNSGNYNLGRRSSDSGAQIKLAPDMTMSRVHAAMRTIKANDGSIHYQITTIKPENPVFVNGTMIEKGKVYSLKPGDMIQMGETILTFKLD